MPCLANADRFGQVIDSTHFSSTAALNGAIKYCSRTNGMAVNRPVEGDDVIHMYPWKMLPECEVRCSNACRFLEQHSSAAAT